MKYKILHLVVILFSVFSLSAQKVNRVFAVTADNSGSNPYLWANINEVDLNSGQVVRPVFENARTNFDLYDGATKIKRMSVMAVNNRVSAVPQMTGSNLIAAAAYDGRHNRFFTTPMHTPELRWIDMDDNNATLKIYTAALPFSTTDLANENNQVTRMVIAADGYGYALTNDANHLIQFSTGRNITVADLGALNDAAGNGAVSVHNKCSSFGGDMISDADGNLYLFSAAHSIFKIDVTSRTAEYIGVIKNLPATYTTNGAAIDDEGSLIVSSANSTDGYYSVNLNTWEATKITGNNKTLGVSDLASSFFAFQKKTPLSPVVFASQVSSGVTLYPNPVTEAAFRISFDNKEAGRYMIQVTDASGRLALQQPINLLFKNQVMEIEMPASVSKGIYMVKIVNAGGKAMYSNKILVN